MHNASEFPNLSQKENTTDNYIITCTLVKIHFNLSCGGVAPLLGGEKRRNAPSNIATAGESLGK